MSDTGRFPGTRPAETAPLVLPTTSNERTASAPWARWAAPAGVTVALLTGLLLRFVEFSSPPYDSHSFRQTQTLSTIEFFHAQGVDLLHPKTNYMGYPGIFVLELPLFQALAAVLYGLLGPHLEIVRVINILFGAGTAWLLYRVVEILLDRRTAVLATLIYWLAPLNILYQRSMLIDPMAVFCAMLSFYGLVSLAALDDGKVCSDRPRRYWIQLVVFGIATWLTAMIKVLYLWPGTVLLAGVVLTRRVKFDLRAARIVAVFAAAGISFLIWNHYAARTNEASPFSRGIQPTSHLGISALADPHYYYNMIVRRPKWWLGVFGVLLYPIGLLAGWSERREPARWAAFLLFVLVPPTYLILFSYMNRPHDYYQLIITPFLAVPPANGLRWLAARFWGLPASRFRVQRLIFPGLCAGILLAAPLSYLFWFHGGRPDGLVLRFEQLCAGRVTPGSSGMVFVANDHADAPPNSYLPEFLYAARLWGYGRVVTNDAGARAYFEELAPAFPKLEYVILYGTDRPAWLAAENFRLASEDDAQRLYVFRRASNYQGP